MPRRESKPISPGGPGIFSRRGDGGVLPLLLLAAALSYIFVFGEHRGHFHWMHDWTSSNNMAVAANLSPDHGFLGFVSRFAGRSGDPEYAPYNRFPIGAAVLTKLAIAPFAGDLSAQIFAAKTLSVLLFCGCALLACLALGRLFHDRWGAAAAVLLAFSSWYALGFADMVGEGMVSLFGVVLAFHGLVVFVQEGRFRQLLGKTCAAVLLGWHAVALVLAFVALSTASAAVRRGGGGGGGRIVAVWRALLRIFGARPVVECLPRIPHGPAARWRGKAAAHRTALRRVRPESNRDRGSVRNPERRDHVRHPVADDRPDRRGFDPVRVFRSGR